MTLDDFIAQHMRQPAHAAVAAAGTGAGNACATVAAAEVAAGESCWHLLCTMLLLLQPMLTAILNCASSVVVVSSQPMSAV
jgi:hypothetical protein